MVDGGFCDLERRRLVAQQLTIDVQLMRQYRILYEAHLTTEEKKRGAPIVNKTYNLVILQTHS